MNKKNNKAIRENELQCLNKIRDSFLNTAEPKLIEEFNNASKMFVQEMFISAYPNQSSTFPDFFFNGGIIEHFEVTPSKENHKGSQYKIDVFKAKS